MSAQRGVVAAWIASLLLAAPAHSQAPALELQACPSLANLAQLVEIELRTSRAHAPAQIRIECQGSLARLRVQRNGLEPLRREISLDSTDPAVRARVLALAIGEAMRELDERVDEPSPPPAASLVSPPPSAARDSAQIQAFFGAGHFSEPGVLWGGGLRWSFLQLAPWRLALDLQAGGYSRDSALGDVSLFAASLGARGGIMLLPVLTLGLGQRVGFASASASPRDTSRAAGDSVSGAWTAALGFVALEWRVLDPWALIVDAELGAVLSPVRGRVDGGDDAAASGLWAVLALGVAVAF